MPSDVAGKLGIISEDDGSEGDVAPTFSVPKSVLNAIAVNAKQAQLTNAETQNFAQQLSEKAYSWAKAQVEEYLNVNDKQDYSQRFSLPSEAQKGLGNQHEHVRKEYAEANDETIAKTVDAYHTKPLKEIGNDLYQNRETGEIKSGYRDIQAEAKIEVRRLPAHNKFYYGSETKVMVGDDVISTEKSQGWADHPFLGQPGFEGNTLKAGTYTGYFLDETFLYDNPTWLVNSDLGAPLDSEFALHAYEWDSQYTIGGPWKQPLSLGCPITLNYQKSTVKAIENLGFEFNGTYGNTDGDSAPVTIFDPYIIVE